jgi:DnaJ family protein C protein 27
MISSTALPEPIRVKILTLGSAKVGKSCLVKKYCEPSRFASSYVPTIGVDYGVKTVNKSMDGGGEVQVKIDFYDLSGTLMKSITR